MVKERIYDEEGVLHVIEGTEEELKELRKRYKKKTMKKEIKEEIKYDSSTR